MRWCTYRRGDAAPRAGLVVADRILSLPPDENLLGLLAAGRDALGLAGTRAGCDPTEEVALEDVELLAPVSDPPSVRDFYAFETHVATARRARGLDMGPDWYELPVFYFSNPHVVHGPDDEVVRPPATEALDFELEVAAVIGVGGSDLTPEEALRHVAGFTVMNDWSARDVQAREMRLGLGPAKGKDFATTLGPLLVTPDVLEERRSGSGYDLEMTARIRRSGESEAREVSRANLADLHWSFGEMIAYASRSSRVEPGDVIGSGTAGTGCLLELRLTDGEDAHAWLGPGDEVTLEVELLGAVRNRVVQPRSEVPSAGRTSRADSAHVRQTPEHDGRSRR